MITQNQLLDIIQQRAQLKTPLVIAIDGYAGAGKSTLAAWLCDRLSTCEVVGLDDFYRPLSGEQQHALHGAEAVSAYLDTGQVIEQILKPLASGNVATWQALDWITQNRLPAKVIAPEGVILLEGVFSTHSDFSPWLDNSILVAAPADERHRRVVARPQPDTDWLAHWKVTEHSFHCNNNTLHHVDWVLAGDAQ